MLQRRNLVGGEEPLPRDAEQAGHRIHAMRPRAAVDEAQRYRTTPVDASDLASGSLSLNVLPQVRTFERRAGVTSVRSEPLQRAGSPAAGGPPPGAPSNTGAVGNAGTRSVAPALADRSTTAADAVAVTRHDVLQVSLLLHVGEGVRRGLPLVIPAPERQGDGK